MTSYSRHLKRRVGETINEREEVRSRDENKGGDVKRGLNAVNDDVGVKK